MSYLDFSTQCLLMGIFTIFCIFFIVDIAQKTIVKFFKTIFAGLGKDRWHSKK